MLDPLHIVALLSLPRIGRKTVQRVLEISKRKPIDAEGLQELLVQIKTQSTTQVPTIDQIEGSLCHAEQVLELANDLGIVVLSISDLDYPSRLRRIPDPPPLLFAKGSPQALQCTSAVAIIGTRKPSTWGRSVAERLGRRFAEAGCTVVSGLALGCDTEAHRGCLEAKGVTVSVLAHGLDTVSPARNRALADEIVAQQGCLVSEYPPGTKPQRRFFVERDRIQSGLSDAIVVVETDCKGGSMHTVRAAQEQSRLIACVKHPPEYVSAPQVEGNRWLIEESQAVPLSDSNDLSLFLERVRPTRQLNTSNEVRAASPDDASTKRSTESHLFD